jgi:hypothetical protein
MVEGARLDAFGDVTDAYSDWVEELPWIHGDDGERAVCVANAELGPTRDAVRALAHHLIARGQAPLADRVERAFERVGALAKDIERFVASAAFDAAEWLYGDVDGAALPAGTPEDADHLPERARELVRVFLDEGHALVEAQHEAAFWLAHQMARGGRDVPEARRAVLEFAHRLRANARDKSSIRSSAIARAYGRLELGWAEVARHLDPELVAALDAFWDELRLAEIASTVPPPHVPAQPSQPTSGAGKGREPIQWAADIIRLKREHPGISKAAAAKALGCNAQHLHRVLRKNPMVASAWDSDVADARHRAEPGSGRRSGRIASMRRRSEDDED